MPLTLSQTNLVSICLQYKLFENTVGNGELAHNKQFLHFPQCFLLLENFLPFSLNLTLSSASSFSLEESKICCLGKRVKVLTLALFFLSLSVSNY